MTTHSSSASQTPTTGRHPGVGTAPGHGHGADPESVRGGRTGLGTRTRAALVAGGVAFAAAGSSAWGTPTLGSPTSHPQTVVAVLGGLLLLVGVLGVRASVRADGARPGALVRCGFGLTVAGLVAHLVSSTLGAVGPLLPTGPADVAAVAAIPAVALAHLAYVGTTLLGIAAWRAGVLPRVLSGFLVACAPLVLVGVPASLALGAGAADALAWLATEGQFGLAWLLVGVVGTWPGVATASRDAVRP